MLMGLSVALMPVPAAMLVVGVAQLAANASRFWLLRQHIHWPAVGYSLLGSITMLGGFATLNVVVDRATLLLMLGGVPLLLAALPRLPAFDIERRPVAVACGVVNMASQLLAGVAGPLLDIFFVKSGLTRHQVIGTKALIGTLGHLFKLLYFGLLVSSAAARTIPGWVWPLSIVAATVGSSLGKNLLERISDQQFRGASTIVIVALSVLFVVQGLLA